MLKANVYHFDSKTYPLEFDADFFNSEASTVINNITLVNYLTFDGKGVDLVNNNLMFFNYDRYRGLYYSHPSNEICGLYDAINFYFGDGTTEGHPQDFAFVFVDSCCGEAEITFYNGEQVIQNRVAKPKGDVMQITAPSGTTKTRVRITKTKLPNQCIRIESIVFGTVTQFDKFKSHRLIEEITVLSDDLPINQFEASVVIDDVKFTKNDPIVLTSNKKYYGTFYVKKIDRVAANIYEITAQNSISFLDTVPLDVWEYDFEYGGANSQEILNRITQLTNVEIEGAYEEIISGIHKDGSCRAALCELGFELAQMVDASRSKSILFKKIPAQITSTILNNDRRIIGNSTFKKKEDISKITIPFKDITEPLGPPRTSKTKTINGEIGDIAVVTFEQPSWIVSEESSGFEVIQETMYSRVIRLTSTKATIVYAEYETYESDFVYINPNAPFANEKKFSNFLTDCRETGQDRNENAKKWARSEGVVTAKIRLRDEKVGDLIQIETAWDGIITGIITKMEIQFGYEDIADIEVFEWSL